nr:hypothetical protein [Lachnospiraceae bacterium]
MEKKKLTWKKIKKAGAIALSFVTMLSTLSFGGAINGSDKAEAASQGYTVDINLYDYDKKTLKDPDETLYSKNNNGPFYVVAVAKGGHPGDVWTTYAVKKVDSLSSKTTTVSFNRSDFRVDNYNGHINDYGNREFNPQTWQWESTGHYDTANTYKMDSVTLYRVKDGLNWWDVKTDNIVLEDLIDQFDRDDAAPEGYKFIDGTLDNNKATIKMYKSDYPAAYEMRLSFTGDGGNIKPEDGYIAIVKVEHATGGDTFYVTDNIDYTGSNLIFKVSESDWLDQNGNPIAKNKFTGHEKSRTVYLVKLMDGNTRPSDSDLIKMQESQVRVISQGSTAGAYSYANVTSGSEKNEVEKIETFYDQLNFTAIPIDTSYNFLSVLGDAANYGIVSNDFTSVGHFESNLAVNKMNGWSSVVQADLSGDGVKHVPGNFIVGEIEEGVTMHFGYPDCNETSYMISTKPSLEKVVLEAGTSDIVVLVETDKKTIDDTINGMLNHMKSVSEYFLSMPTVKFDGEGEKGAVIDITSFPENAVVCVDGDKYLKAMAEDANGLTQGINIKCKDSQLVVFNFDEDYKDRKITINTINVNGYDSTTTPGGFNNDNNNQADYVSQHVVWNLATAKDVDLNKSGGIYLTPKKDAFVDVVGPACGWIVNAGHTQVGVAEFHFVYQGLTRNDRVNLKLAKTVDGVAAANNQVFDFTVEKLEGNDFVPVQIYDDQEEKMVDYIVQNKGKDITIPVTEMQDGKNVIRIKEKTKAGYEENTQVFYAVFEVKVIMVGTTPVKIPGTPTYYTDFDVATNKASNQVTSTPTFQNKKLDDIGNLYIYKTFSGDITQDEFEGALSFDVEFPNGDVKTYKLASDGFSFNSTNNRYELLLEDVPVGDYKVTEKTVTPLGRSVSVSYTLDGGASTDTGINSEVDASVTRNTDTELAFNDVYKEQKGTLIVQKVLPAGSPVDFTHPFEFELYKDGVATGIKKTTNGNGEAVFTGLDVIKDYTANPVVKYVYTVVETDSSAAVAGYTNSVTYSPADAVVGYATRTTIDATNTYTRETGTLKITKTIKGSVTPEEADGLLKFTVTGPEYPNGQEFTIGQGGFDYDATTKVYTLTLDGIKAGKYTVEETTKNIDGNDVTVKYTVDQTTTEGTKASNLDVAAGGTAQVDFEDDYASIPVEVHLSANKTLTGETLAANQFSFTLSDAQGVLQTKKNDRDGNVTFDTLSFDQAGTYTYTVEETDKTDTTNYEYSDEVYTVVVTVTEDKGKLARTTKITNKAGTEVVTMDFANTKKD